MIDAQRLPHASIHDKSVFLPTDSSSPRPAPLRDPRWVTPPPVPHLRSLALLQLTQDLSLHLVHRRRRVLPRRSRSRTHWLRLWLWLLHGSRLRGRLLLRRSRSRDRSRGRSWSRSWLSHHTARRRSWSRHGSHHRSHHGSHHGSRGGSRSRVGSRRGADHWRPAGRLAGTGLAGGRSSLQAARVT